MGFSLKGEVLLIPKSELRPDPQIPAYVQLPALFQPRVPSQPSTHLHHSQAPHPATISVIPMLGQDANHFCKPSATSKGGNEMATSSLSACKISYILHRYI